MLVDCQPLNVEAKAHNDISLKYAIPRFSNTITSPYTDLYPLMQYYKQYF